MAEWATGDVITQTRIREYSGLRQNFRGLRLRTHPDQDVAASKVMLVHADEIQVDDGFRYTDWDNLVADITVSGAGGLDTGSEGASRWYEIYAIRKSSDGTKNLLLHRAPDYSSGAAFTTATDASRALRLATGTATDKLAQGVRLSASAPLHFIKVKLIRTGAVSGRIWFSIQADSSGNPSGTALATTDKIDASKIATSEQQLLLIFRSPTTPSASPTQYHLVLEGDYTRSDTVNIAWRGVAAGGYADGSAKEYNGATWGAASGVGDFNFDAYILQNSTSVTMPTGYDQKCLIGYVYNDSGSNLNPFFECGRRVIPLENVAITGVTSTTMVLTDLSTVLPPVPCSVTWAHENTTADSAGHVGPVPDGLTFTNEWGNRDGGMSWSLVPIANRMGSHEPVLTEYQATYLSVSAGTGIFRLGHWEWF